MQETTQVNFYKIIEKITKNQLLLPDFQRKFVWKAEQKQVDLLASVIAKMPVGSFLVLKGNPKQYCCQPVGVDFYIESEKLNDEIELLLDGQQRITVLTNVFSNVIFDSIDKMSQLKSDGLQRRFFLKLPKWNGRETDIFGAKTLQFPKELYEVDDPPLLSDEIREIIEVNPITAMDKNVYHPKTKADDTEILAACKKENYYKIPLYYMFDSENGNRSGKLDLILDDIKEDIIFQIMQQYSVKVESERKAYIRTILDKAAFETIPFSENNRDFFAEKEEIRKKLVIQGNRWIRCFSDYLKSCICNMKIHQITVENTNRDRAIDIYENMNIGCVSLKAFDLIMAKVANISSENYYDRIRRIMEQTKEYPKNVVPEILEIEFQKLLVQEEYHASMWLKCMDKNELISGYTDTFLNVMSLLIYIQDFGYTGISVSLIKKKHFFDLNSKYITNLCERVVRDIDRAMFFFHMRCGIRKFSEIKYRLMITLVSVVLDYDENYYNKQIHNYLESWYWSSVFSGTYDRDQNQSMITDLICMLNSVETKDFEWLKKRSADIFSDKEFSSEEFLIVEYEKPRTKYPKDILKYAIAQFYLSRTYNDFCTDVTITPLLDENQKLELHHLMPLGSSEKNIRYSSEELRKDKGNLLNSPVNYVYITSKSNKKISNKSIESYIKGIDKTTLDCLGVESRAESYFRQNDAMVLTYRFHAIKSAVTQECRQLLGK